jgi:hypothetical protein
MALDADIQGSAVRVTHENGSPVPFTIRDRTLAFFVGTPGTVRVVAGDRESVYSLTLPQLWESRWEPPKDARRGVPRFAGMGDASFDLWYWLALAGGLGLLAEWVLFGRFSRGLARVFSMRNRATARKAGVR